jgi:hypothetical protein
LWSIAGGWRSSSSSKKELFYRGRQYRERSASDFPKPHRGLQSEIEGILCAVGLNLAALHLDQAARQRQADSHAAERQQRSRRHAVEDPPEKILHPSNKTRQLKHLQYRAGDLAAV